MTADEKQALLQFMGVTYGAAVKMDRDIVSSSNQLTPISDSIKYHFERLMPVPVDDYPHTQPVSPPPPVTEPTPLGAAYPPELQPAAPEPIPQQAYQGTVAHDPTLIDTLISIRMALTRIGDILELKQANDKPAKKSKAQQT